MGKWGATVVIPQYIADWSIDTGALCAYLGTQAIATIRKRTAEGRDADGVPFKPYKPVDMPELNPTESLGGKVEKYGDWRDRIKRDTRGRWNMQRLRGPEDPVNLRSIRNRPDSARMMENLRMIPKTPAPDARFVTIAPGSGGGTSKRAAAKMREELGAAASQYIAPSFWVRGMTVVGDGEVGRRVAAAGTARKFVGLSGQEWADMLREIKVDHVLAWVQANQDRINAERIEKARKAAEAAVRKVEREARRAEAAARRRGRTGRGGGMSLPG